MNQQADEDLKRAALEETNDAIYPGIRALDDLIGEHIAKFFTKLNALEHGKGIVFDRLSLISMLKADLEAAIAKTFFVLTEQCKQAQATADGQTQTCPRRMSEMGPWEYKPDSDRWNKVGSDRVCSFCGSMHPEDFERVLDQALVDEKTTIEQSDKPYKVYIRREGITNASRGAIKYYKQHNYTDQESIDRITPKFVTAIKASMGRLSAETNQFRETLAKAPGHGGPDKTIINE